MKVVEKARDYIKCFKSNRPKYLLVKETYEFASALLEVEESFQMIADNCSDEAAAAICKGWLKNNSPEE